MPIFLQIPVVFFEISNLIKIMKIIHYSKDKLIMKIVFWIEYFSCMVLINKLISGSFIKCISQ